MKRPLLVFLGIFLFRSFIATYVLRTSFQPDEWFQGTEVAYKYVMSTSTVRSSSSSTTSQQHSELVDHQKLANGIKLSWDWDEKIRSFIFPLPFVLLYKVGALIFSPEFMTAFYWYAPKIVAALLGTLTDHQVYRVGESLFGLDVAKDALLLSVLSWWNCFHLRTYSNLVEGFLLLLCLRPNTSHRTFFLIAVLGCSLRITFLIPIMLPALQTISRSIRIRGFSLAQVIIEGLLIGMVGLALVCAVDSWYYEEAGILTPWRFVYFNLLSGNSAAFGTHPFHWYFSNGLLVVLGPHLILIPAILGVQPPALILNLLRATWISGESGSGAVYYSPLNLPRRFQDGFITLATVVTSTIGIYSFIGHKEFRFIDPVVPCFMILLALPFTYSLRWRSIKRYVMVFVSVLSLVIFTIFGVLHQRGTLAATDYLRTLPADGRDGGGGQQQQQVVLDSVHVLMGCHSFPGYHALHGRIKPGGLVQNDCSLSWREEDIPQDFSSGDPDDWQVVDPSSGARRTHLRPTLTEHKMFADDPFNFIKFLYFSENPHNDHQKMDQLYEMTQGAGFQGYRKLPERFVMFKSTAEKLKDLLLQPSRDKASGASGARRNWVGKEHRYELEISFFHTFFLPEDTMDYTVEIWKKVQ